MSLKQNTPQRDFFSNKFGIIAATAGSAIGLGNIWRFPYIVGENGGAAFLIILLLIKFGIGLPVMLSEFSIGRHTQRNPFGAFRMLAPGKSWWIVGFMGIIAAFTIMAFYSVVAGWTLDYLYNSVLGGFNNKSADDIQSMFGSFIASGWQPIVWLFIFVGVSSLIVVAGIKKGIEKYTKILMPALLVIIVVLSIRALSLPGAEKGLEFFFKPDFSKITSASVLEALGQSFFSLSIGMGVLLTYGSYVQKTDNIGSTTFIVAFADTAIAILAGMVIFPAVFAFGISPGKGPELVFITLPNIFEQMPAGYIFSVLFFVLLTVAAITSFISIQEVVVAYLSEELKIKRKTATLLAAGGAVFLGSLCALSQSGHLNIVFGDMNLFDILDFVSSNILLPLGGLLIVIFVAWFMGKERLLQELRSKGLYKANYFPVYNFIIRYIAPIAITVVFLSKLGLI